MTALVAVVLLGLAAARVSEVVARDVIGEPLREHVANRWPPDERRAIHRWRGGVSSVVPAERRRRTRPHGPAVLVACVYCLDVWAAGALTGATWLVRGLPMPPVVWLAAAAVAGATHRARP